MWVTDVYCQLIAARFYYLISHCSCIKLKVSPVNQSGLWCQLAFLQARYFQVNYFTKSACRCQVYYFPRIHLGTCHYLNLSWSTSLSDSSRCQQKRVGKRPALISRKPPHKQTIERTRVGRLDWSSVHPGWWVQMGGHPARIIQG